MNKLETSIRFHILRNVKFLLNESSPSVFGSIIPNNTEAILNSDNNLTSIMAGMYENGRALVFPKEEFGNYILKTNYEKLDPNLFVNIAKWLTNGACINLSECVIPINYYKSHLEKDNLVVVYGQTFNVNTTDTKLMKKLISGSWGIIFSGTYWHKIYLEHKKLIKMFGICPLSVRNTFNTKMNLKWCENIHQETKNTC